MLAVQFQTVKHPNERDTRSIWQLRDDLEKEKKQQVQLNKEIAHYEMLLNEYKQNSDKDRVDVMEEALNKLKQNAGLTTIADKGMILRIEPLFDVPLIGEEVPTLTPQLLMRLINQLSTFGFEHIQIGEQRMTTLSAIREVNDETFVNNRPLPELPIEIKVISDDVAKLYDQFKASKIMDEFAKENLAISAELKNKLIISPYERNFNLKYMEQDKEDS